VGLRITDAYGQSHDEPTVPEPNEAYLAELKAFLDGESTLATIADGARVLAVIDASRRSSAERREVAI
jgi:predicted dehydrogenase